MTAGDILLADHNSRIPDQSKLFHTPSSTVYYNYFYGIELLLTSYLLHTGTTIEDVEKHIRYDVAGSLNRCLKRGICDVCPDLDTSAQAAIVDVSEPYWRKRFEYLGVGGLHLPHVGRVVKPAHALVAGLSGLKMDRWQSLPSD